MRRRLNGSGSTSAAHSRRRRGYAGARAASAGRGQARPGTRQRSRTGQPPRLRRPQVSLLPGDRWPPLPAERPASSSIAGRRDVGHVGSSTRRRSGLRAVSVLKARAGERLCRSRVQRPPPRFCRATKRYLLAVAKPSARVSLGTTSSSQRRLAATVDVEDEAALSPVTGWRLLARRPRPAAFRSSASRPVWSCRNWTNVMSRNGTHAPTGR
jgi:hypothetical protein